MTGQRSGPTTKTKCAYAGINAVDHPEYSIFKSPTAAAGRAVPRRVFGVTIRSAARILCAAVVATALLVGCSGPASPTLPQIELPTWDPDSIARMLDDAVEQMREVDPLASVPPIAESVQGLVDQYGIDALPVPTNAADICNAMGSPNPDNLAAGGLVSIIRALASEIGMGVGLLVSVIFGTCDTWAPFVDSALEDLFTVQRLRPTRDGA